MALGAIAALAQTGTGLINTGIGYMRSKNAEPYIESAMDDLEAIDVRDYYGSLRNRLAARSKYGFDVQQRSMAENAIDRSAALGLKGMENRRSGLLGMSRMSSGLMGAYTDLNMRDFALEEQKTQALLQHDAQIAGMRHKEDIDMANVRLADAFERRRAGEGLMNAALQTTMSGMGNLASAYYKDPTYDPYKWRDPYANDPSNDPNWDPNEGAEDNTYGGHTGGKVE